MCVLGEHLADEQVQAIFASLDFAKQPILPFEPDVAKILKFMNPLLHRKDVKQQGSILDNEPKEQKDRKREAEEGRAKNENQARKEVAKSKADADIAESQAAANAHVEMNAQKQRENESDKDLAMRKAEIDTEVAKSQAIAKQSGVIENENQQKGM